MLFKINPELFDRLCFYPKNKYRSDDKFVIVEDGIWYTLNPLIDSLQIDDQIIELAPFHEAIKKSEKFLWDNHSEWMRRSSDQFRLSFYQRKGQATAFYREDLSTNKRDPIEIKMCLSYFLNLNDFKFVLGHEVGHFDQHLSHRYFKPKSNDLVNSICGSIAIISFTVFTAVFLFQYKEKLPEFMIIFNTIVAFLYSFYYFVYCSENFNQILKSHFAEYDADSFSFKMYPECKTSYFKKTWIYSDTHPANIFRILAVRFGIRIYLPIIPPWFLGYCKSHDEYKENWSEFLKEIPKLPQFLYQYLTKWKIADKIQWKEKIVNYAGIRKIK